MTKAAILSPIAFEGAERVLAETRRLKDVPIEGLYYAQNRLLAGKESWWHATGDRDTEVAVMSEHTMGTILGLSSCLVRATVNSTGPSWSLCDVCGGNACEAGSNRGATGEQRPEETVREWAVDGDQDDGEPKEELSVTTRAYSL